MIPKQEGDISKLGRFFNIFLDMLLNKIKTSLNVSDHMISSALFSNYNITNSIIFNLLLNSSGIGTTLIDAFNMLLQFSNW